MSQGSSAASAYRESLFESAPPIKILQMMYEGAIRFLKQAETLDPESRAKDFDERLDRAMAIVEELRVTLDTGHAPELSEKLTSLYLFVEGEIRDAFSKRDGAGLEAARNVLETLLEGWKEVDLSQEVE